MDEKQTLKEEVLIERNKLKKMSWKDRVWYIWEYYKFHILAAVLAVTILYIFGGVLYRQTFTTRLNIAIVNDRSGGMSSVKKLSEHLHEALGLGEKDLIDISEGLSASFDGNAMSQYDYASLAKISALAASDSLDIIISDGAAVNHFGESSALADLEEFLPPETLEKVRDHLYYAKDSEGVSHAYAISLQDSILPEETGIVMDPPYFSVIERTLHREEVLRTLDYLIP
jgi:hypothetical protein